MDTGRGPKGAVGGRPFLDVAVSTSSTALTIRTPTDGETGRHPEGESQPSSLMRWAV
jgi:hypothetical protein